MIDPNLHTFDTRRGWHLFLHDAYQGGYRWEHPTSGPYGTATLYEHRVVTTAEGDAVVEQALGSELTYLVPWPGESALNFARRRSLAVYINLTEPVIDAYVDSVTARVSRDLGPLAPYLRSLDGQGQSWKEMVANACHNAAMDGVAAVVLDAPLANPAANRAEEIALGVGLRATVVPLASWAWIRLDDDGCVEEFAYLDAQASDTTGTRARVWVWTRSTWAVYDASLPTTSTLTELRGVVLRGTPKRTGPVSPRLHGALPVTFVYNRRNAGTRVPEGKSLAAAPATIGRQIYQLLSQIEDTHRRAPPFLAMPTKATGGSLEPEVQAKVGPDHAAPVPEGSGPAQWVTFPPESLKDIREHVVFLVALAFRISGLEVQADTSAQVQSGEALRVRSRGFEAKALKLAQELEAFERRALHLCGLYLGMDPDAAQVTYPMRYVLGDTSELLDAALTVLEKVGDQLGPLAKSALLRQALAAATSLDDAQLALIMQEIDARLTKPAETPQKELFAYDYESGIVYVDEARATKGLAPLPEGKGQVPVSQWKAQTTQLTPPTTQPPPQGA